jgi:hypothetical protein
MNVTYQTVSYSAQFTSAEDANAWVTKTMKQMMDDGLTITSMGNHRNYRYDRKGYVKKDSQYWSASVSGSIGTQVNQYEDDLDADF